MTRENEAKAQYTFDQVAAHLIEQGQKSTLLGIECAYRGENGLRCAIGFCISNENYRFEMEDHNITYSCASLGSKTILEMVDKQYSHDEDFMNSLQAIHDKSIPSVWPGKLKMFARMYGLDGSIVDIILNARLPVPTLINKLTTI
jgi:hypothetical protein